MYTWMGALIFIEVLQYPCLFRVNYLHCAFSLFSATLFLEMEAFCKNAPGASKIKSNISNCIPLLLTLMITWNFLSVYLHKDDLCLLMKTFPLKDNLRAHIWKAFRRSTKLTRSSHPSTMVMDKKCVFNTTAAIQPGRRKEGVRGQMRGLNKKV